MGNESIRIVRTMDLELLSRIILDLDLPQKSVDVDDSSKWHPCMSTTNIVLVAPLRVSRPETARGRQLRGLNPLKCKKVGGTAPTPRRGIEPGSVKLSQDVMSRSSCLQLLIPTRVVSGQRAKGRGGVSWPEMSKLWKVNQAHDLVFLIATNCLII
jgi:hypothetical protein